MAMTKTLFGAVVVAGLVFAGQAQGQLLTDSGAGATPTNGTGSGMSLGYMFQVDSAMDIGALGIADFGSDGLSDSHEVGLFQFISGNWSSLGSVVVPSGTATTKIGDFRYAELASPISLSSGNIYSLFAFYSASSSDAFRNASTTNPSLASGVTYYDGGGTSIGWYTTGVSGAAPGTVANSEGGAPYIGPNALVPEPASLALLGLGGLAMVARRRQA